MSSINVICVSYSDSYMGNQKVIYACSNEVDPNHVIHDLNRDRNISEARYEVKSIPLITKWKN